MPYPTVVTNELLWCDACLEHVPAHVEYDDLDHETVVVRESCPNAGRPIYRVRRSHEIHVGDRISLGMRAFPTYYVTVKTIAFRYTDRDYVVNGGPAVGGLILKELDSVWREENETHLSTAAGLLKSNWLDWEKVFDPTIDSERLF